MVTLAVARMGEAVALERCHRARVALDESEVLEARLAKPDGQVDARERLRVRVCRRQHNEPRDLSADELRRSTRKRPLLT